MSKKQKIKTKKRKEKENKKHGDKIKTNILKLE